MTTVDWIVLGMIALFAITGLRRGLVVGALSLFGLVIGGWIGSRVGPAVLPADKEAWVPVAALAGAVLGAALVQSAAGMAGGTLRKSLLVVPPLRALDSAGGLLLGAATGIALAWVVGAAALYAPGQADARRVVQESKILTTVNDFVPPTRLIEAIGRVDPFGAIAGPAASVEAPDAAVLNSLGVRAARSGVVRVTGVACGLGVEGSGWVAARGLVVTNAHVVAGVNDPRIDRNDGRFRSATIVAFDPKNDLAILRVRGLGTLPLGFADAEKGTPAAILGFPDNGPFRAAPARLGATRQLLTRDAYGKFPTARRVLMVRGDIRHGNSGGPIVDADGVVRGVVFASATTSDGGYSVPVSVVRDLLERAGTRRIETSCTDPG